MIANGLFTKGMAGEYEVLEEYYKSIYTASIPYSTLIKMTPEEVSEDVERITSNCFSCEYLKSYIDFETHDFVMIFQKGFVIDEPTQKQNLKRDIEKAMTI